MSLFKKFKSFLSKNSDELHMIANAIDPVVRALPIDSQTKAHVTGIVDTLHERADSIAEAVKSLKDEPIHVTPSMVEDAVRILLPDILRAIVKENTAQPEQAQDQSSGS